MKVKSFLLMLYCSLLFSCSENITQDYSTVNKFKESSLRKQSWFPDIVLASSYDLKEIHNLSSNNSYGSFKYTDTLIFNAKFQDTSICKEITLTEFAHQLNKINSPKRPSWFSDSFTETEYTFFKQGRFYIARNKKERILYFFLND